MKIKIEEIKPNPFRRMEHYPIDRSKIEALKNSINETGFWDNILARRKNGVYEIAYGHHRWIAVKGLGIKEVDIPVRDLSDAMMIKIMAEENLNWSTTPAVINESIRATKAFLDAELQKYDDWNHANKSISMIFKSNSQFQNCKQHGVGQGIILKFLGPNWKQWMIQEALSVLTAEQEGWLNREAVETIANVTKAREFHRCVKAFGTPKAKQMALAEQISEKDTPTEQIRMVVARASQNKHKPTVLMNELEKLVKTIDDEARVLVKKIRELRRQMEDLNIQELKGLKVWLAACSLRHLTTELERMKDDTQKA